MPRRPEEALLPLLALTQCAALIDHLAATGTVDQDALGLVIDCLYGTRGLGEFPPETAGDYAIGVAVLKDLLGGKLPENQRKIPAYMRSLVRLERKLARYPTLLSLLRERLAELRDRQAAFALPPANVHAALGGIYAQTLGRLQPSVSVTGSLRQISDRHNADLIRTLILGGVQAAYMWRRAGGRWWWLRFQRKATLRDLTELTHS